MAFEELAQYLVSGLMTGAVYALVALGFNLVYNGTQVINFAQGEFVMLGGMLYYASTQQHGLPIVAGLAIAVAGVGAIAAMFELTVIHQARHATVLGVVLITLAFAILTESVARAIWGVNPLSVPRFSSGPPVEIGDVVITRQAFWVVGSALVVMFVLRWFTTRTDTGLAMQAVSMNRSAAEAVGVPVHRMVLIAFLLAGLLGGVGGVLITPITNVHYLLGLGMAIKGFTAAILGGLGNMTGAVVGGLVLGLIEALGTAYISSGFRDAVPMVVLIALLLVRPTGLLGKGVIERA